MSSFHNLNTEIFNCEQVLQQYRHERWQIQRAMWQRAQLPLMLISGFCLGVSLQSYAMPQPQQNGTNPQAKAAMLRALLWRWLFGNLLVSR
jgi:hypothetical protein